MTKTTKKTPGKDTQPPSGDRHREALRMLMDYVVDESAAAARRRLRLVQWKALLKKVPTTQLQQSAREALEEVMDGIEEALKDEPGQRPVQN